MPEYHQEAEPENPEDRFVLRTGRYLRQRVQNSVRVEIAQIRMEKTEFALFQLYEQYAWRAYEEINDHVREGRFS